MQVEDCIKKKQKQKKQKHTVTLVHNLSKWLKMDVHITWRNQYEEHQLKDLGTWVTFCNFTWTSSLYITINSTKAEMRKTDNKK